MTTKIKRQKHEIREQSRELTQKAHKNRTNMIETQIKGGNPKQKRTKIHNNGRKIEHTTKNLAKWYKNQT